MTDDFQAIDGVGPAREEHFINEGYEAYADLAEADPAELSEQIDNLPEDSALEIVVQSQNLTDLEEAEVEEDPEVESGDDSESQSASETETITESSDGTEVVMDVEGDDGGEDVEEDEEDEEDVDDSEPETHTLELTLASDGQYDALYDTLLSHRNTLIGRNSHEVDRYTEHIDALREAVVGDTLKYELTADEINSLHNAIRQKRLDYQGANLNDQLAPARELETKFNNQREELIF